MLSLVRPAAHASFAGEAQQRLDALGVIAESGRAISSKDFESRALWKVAKHKAKLVATSQPFAKCAWCEEHHDTRRMLNVEHYRPKTEITRWVGSPLFVTDEPPKEESVSDGYWWLAFKWDNYSLACITCNQTWKRNLFPVHEPRPPYARGMEEHEVPLLLDPMSPFRTGDHFSWTALGEMRPESLQGEATIITCGLNRKRLMSLRGKAANNVLKKIKQVVRADECGVSPIPQLQELRALCAPAAEFAGMNRWWVEQQIGWTWEELDAATS